MSDILDQPLKQGLVQESLSLEERVSRLEGRLGWGSLLEPVLSVSVAFASIICLSFGMYCAYRGLGTPNHYYQGALAVLLTLVLYHLKFLILPTAWFLRFLPVLNAAVLTLILKIFIGSGTRYPLSWLMYPGISKNSSESNSWKDIVPSWSIEWIPGPMAGWSIDLTIVQTFLLLLTIIAAMFGFQPFASMVALVLVLFSIPALVSFSWPWVFPAILLAAVGLYFQSRKFNSDF